MLHYIISAVFFVWFILVFAYVCLAEERKLSELECPLLVQLNWGQDDREGRLLLKREIDKTTAVCFPLCWPLCVVSVCTLKRMCIEFSV